MSDTMRKFRSKPTIIEAVQFVANGASTQPVEGMKLWPDDDGVQPRDMSWGYVITIHGDKASVQHGDYVVREPDGIHHYPVKPEIFEKRWEPFGEEGL